MTDRLVQVLLGWLPIVPVLWALLAAINIQAPPHEPTPVVEEASILDGELSTSQIEELFPPIDTGPLSITDSLSVDDYGSLLFTEAVIVDEIFTPSKMHIGVPLEITGTTTFKGHVVFADGYSFRYE